MLRMMKTRFLPANYKQLLHQQYQKCKQRNQNVVDYTEVFHMLSVWTRLNESENYQIARFIVRLKDENEVQY